MVQSDLSCVGWLCMQNVINDLHRSGLSQCTVQRGQSAVGQCQSQWQAQYLQTSDSRISTHPGLSQTLFVVMRRGSCLAGAFGATKP